MKEETPSHIALRTDTYITDTNKLMKDDKFPWLEADGKDYKFETERSLN